MWPSLSVANYIADVANWFFIDSLVVGVVSTTLIVWMSGVKEAHWEKDRTASAERIAQLNNDTEHLKSENLRLQTQLAPRSLSKEQFDEIQTLKGKIPKVNLAVEDDLESNMFAGLLAVALQKADIIVHQYNLPPGFRGNSRRREASAGEFRIADAAGLAAKACQRRAGPPARIPPCARRFIRRRLWCREMGLRC